MSIFHKSAAALAVLAALASATGAHAMGIVSVAAQPVTGGDEFPYTYSYKVTPSFNASQLAFTFSDPNVTFGSVTGPLDVVTPTSPGSFINFSSTGAFLAANTSETITFTSMDGPHGGTFIAAGTGAGGAGSSSTALGPGQVLGPAPVPEASTIASLGLLLSFGLGGVVVAARKNNKKNAA